ncbi:MAG: hypothetical protein H6582_01180 [Crocinitomicaceae bacterium]|nr:hypothetical protein [Crocinitomicaceae bacterium]
MKNGLNLSGVLMIVIILSSCSKEKQQQRWLVGEWNANQQILLTDTSGSDINSFNGTFTVEKDLSGISTLQDSQGNSNTEDFTISTSEDVGTVTINFSTSGAVTYSVVDNQKQHQEWHYYNTESGLTIESTLKLTKD